MNYGSLLIHQHLNHPSSFQIVVLTLIFLRLSKLFEIGLAVRIPGTIVSNYSEVFDGLKQIIKSLIIIWQPK
jgi:hypothetical protein